MTTSSFMVQGLSSLPIRTPDRHVMWQEVLKHLICTVSAHFLALAPFHPNVCGQWSYLSSLSTDYCHCFPQCTEIVLYIKVSYLFLSSLGVLLDNKVHCTLFCLGRYSIGIKSIWVNKCCMRFIVRCFKKSLPMCSVVCSMNAEERRKLHRGAYSADFITLFTYFWGLKKIMNIEKLICSFCQNLLACTPQKAEFKARWHDVTICTSH